MRRILLPCLTGLCFFLQGCYQPHDMQSSGIDLPFGWSIGGKKLVETDDEVAIEQRWWQNFNDPLLNDLIEKAIDGNKDLAIALARVEEARAGTGGAKAESSRRPIEPTWLPAWNSRSSRSNSALMMAPARRSRRGWSR